MNTTKAIITIFGLYFITSVYRSYLDYNLTLQQLTTQCTIERQHDNTVR